MTSLQRIEKEFDEMCRHPEYTDVVTATRPEIKSFITKCLTEARQSERDEILKIVEGMEPREEAPSDHIIGYRTAKEDLRDLLNKKEITKDAN